jgi:hypothetical protein
MHAILGVTWQAKLASMPSNSEVQIEGEDLADIVDQVQSQIERLYQKPVKQYISELSIALLEEGRPVKVEKLKDRFKIKVYLTVGLEKKPVRRKAKT